MTDGHAQLELFEALVELDTAERERYLATCNATADVIADVRELLAFHEHGASRIDGLLGRRPERQPVPTVGTLLLDRYRLGERLGRGGFGSVHHAVDTLAGRAVAIKFLDGVPPGMTWRVRDEIAWLRILALRGVPRVLDEGEASGCPWFAMEHVEGERFPGHGTPVAWSRLAPTAIALLDTLAVIHAAGLVHLDLKPANVLVADGPRLTLLDFGISARGRGRASDVVALRAGTPPYAAPEQLEGGALGPAADLYAVGVMLHEALGTQPGGAFPADVPAHVRALLVRLVDPQPTRRPPSCHHVLAELEHRRFGKPRDVDWSRPESLRALFAGHERVLHEPEDAAKQLHRLADGDATRGWATIQTWLRTGLAVPQGDRLLVERASLDELAAHALLSAGRRRDVPALEVGADSLEEAGLVERALALRVEVVRARARDADVAARREAARALVLTALRAQSITASDEALRTLASAGLEHDELRGAQPLLAFAARANHGDGRRALDELERLGAVDDRELEDWRQTVMMRAAMSSGLDVMRRICAAARTVHGDGDGDRLRAARHALWDGLIAYHEGAFATAARHHERAAKLGVRRTDRLRAQLNAANAWLEALELERAEDAARAAGLEAAEARFPQLEARAVLIERSAIGRACRPLEPDADFADAVARLGSTAIEAQVLRTEATLAWRAGRHALGRALAERSAAAWGTLGQPLGVALSRAIGAVCGEPLTGAQLAHAQAQVVEARLPRVALQLAALLVDAGADIPPLPRGFPATEAPPKPHLRWEIYSWDELARVLHGRWS